MTPVVPRSIPRIGVEKSLPKFDITHIQRSQLPLLFYLSCYELAFYPKELSML